MKRKSYDLIFFTYEPNFYKVNLYNKISKKKKILVIYLGMGNGTRQSDFFNSDMNFSYIFLNKCEAKKRNIIYSCLKLLKILKIINYKLIITMGWSCIEDFLIVSLSPKVKNASICESSIYESNLNNWKRYLKKFICSRLSYTFVSGEPHKKIFENLNFKGKIIVTGGVGIFNKNNKRIEKMEENKKVFNYLCVARLISVKNLEFLIEVFNKNGKNLTIAGKGILEEKLKKIAKENIQFVGYISNKEIGKLYQKYDIFILPSKSEAWGLVIEEALYNGLPVLVSDKVGSNIDMVSNYNSGEIFKFNNEEDLNNKIEIIEKNYNYYLRNVKKIDFEKIEKRQIECYL